MKQTTFGIPVTPGTDHTEDSGWTTVSRTRPETATALAPSKWTRKSLQMQIKTKAFESSGPGERETKRKLDKQQDLHNHKHSHMLHHKYKHSCEHSQMRSHKHKYNLLNLKYIPNLKFIKHHKHKYNLLNLKYMPNLKFIKHNVPNLKHNYYQVTSTSNMLKLKPHYQLRNGSRQVTSSGEQSASAPENQIGLRHLYILQAQSPHKAQGGQTDGQTHRTARHCAQEQEAQSPHIGTQTGGQIDGVTHRAAHLGKDSKICTMPIKPPNTAVVQDRQRQIIGTTDGQRHQTDQVAEKCANTDGFHRHSHRHAISETPFRLSDRWDYLQY